MATRVVCISSLDGAGGEEVARLVASSLGVRLVDEEIIRRAAREAGVDSRVVADAEQRKSLLARVARELRQAGVAAGPAVGVVYDADTLADETDDFRGLIRSAVEETAAAGECVIAAHAASVALTAKPGVLRVLVTASRDTRSERLARERGVDAREAAKLVEKGDAGRSDYLKRFYGVREELPTLYDLVVNTDRLAPEQAAPLVAAAAASGAPPGDEIE